MTLSLDPLGCLCKVYRLNKYSRLSNSLPYDVNSWFTPMSAGYLFSVKIKTNDV